MFLTYRRRVFCDLLPANFNRAAIRPLCDAVSKCGKPKAVIKPIGRYSGIMALRDISEDGHVARSLWHGSTDDLEDLAHAAGAVIRYLD
jgi:hypothetical protein